MKPIDMEMETANPAIKTIPKIVNKGDDFWEIQIRLTLSEILDNRLMLMQLNEVKKYISETENVPMGLLRYEGITERKELSSEMHVTVRMWRCPIQRGDPVIRFMDKTNEDGSCFPDMKAVIDLHPLDTKSLEITLDKIQRVIQESGVSETLVDPTVIEEKVQEVMDTKCSLKNTTVAIGAMPENGEDAEVEFFFPTESSADDSDQCYRARHVKAGDLICRKIPPNEGKKPGLNVKGEEISSRKGLDIILRPLKGVSLSEDGLEVRANEDGIVVINQILYGTDHHNQHKVFSSEIQLSVNPVLKIKGEQTIDITTGDAVEVDGNLKIGSRIITKGEVFISGSVENESTISSNENISVKGDVIDSELSSDKDITTQGDVYDSKIVAKGKVILKGIVNHTEIAGTTIQAKHISGSNVVARDKLIVDTLDDDKSNLVSFIAIGAQQFLQTRHEINDEFLPVAMSNLRRITNIIGEPYASAVTYSNLQQQWGKFCNTIRSQRKLFNQKQLTDLRTLFQNIPTMKEIINLRQEENRMINDVVSRTKNEEAVIEVKEKVGKSQEVLLNGRSHTLEASDTGAHIFDRGEQEVKS